jgi:hypothetical protein
VRASGWELAMAVVEEGLSDDVIPALVRLGRVAQLGDLPTFVAELGREVHEPLADRMRVAGPLAGIARAHARQRGQLGFAPRDVVTEFLLLRRVLWRFVATRVAGIGRDELFEVERRLNDTIDRLSSNASSPTSTAPPQSSQSRLAAIPSPGCSTTRRSRTSSSTRSAGRRVTTTA